MILFLNKIDLFAEKVKRKSIRSLFPGYMGGSSYDEQLKYIEDKFLDAPSAPKTANDKTIYVHRTCATDTKQVQVVIDSVVDTIIQDSLRKMGIK